VDFISIAEEATDRNNYWFIDRYFIASFWFKMTDMKKNAMLGNAALVVTIIVSLMALFDILR
jgi:hypothetical protein